MITSAFAWIADAANWGGDAGIWMRLLQHLGVTGLVVLAAAVVAVPAGIAIGHTGKGRALVTFTSGAARALPTLGLLTLFALALGIGLAAPFWALVILAFPPLLAAAYSGVESADKVTVDASRAIGMTGMQVLRHVELPAAFPILVGGLRSTVLQVASTATLAAYTADIGLGRFLFVGMKTNHYEVMIGGALLVVVLTLVLDVVLALCQKAVERRAG
ncbi:MAG: ABC transporter permease subunit [Coriobacteriaceae bacterium]|nr:ABC transporter permease subunit [Coriobacteriaceae bacterium]